MFHSHAGSDPGRPEPAHPPSRWLLRALQRYTVTIHERDARRLLAQGDIEELIPGLFVQVSGGIYDPVLGLQADPAGPVPLIV